MSLKKVVKKRSNISRKLKEEYDPEEEKELEKLVFGDPNDVFEHLEENEIKLKINKDGKILDDESIMDMDDEESESSNKLEAIKRKPAWVDNDEEDYNIKKALTEQSRRLPGERPEKSYNELLEKKFMSIVGTPKWAEINKKEIHSDNSDDDDDNVLRHCSHIGIHKSTKLKETIIDIKVLHNLNSETNAEGPFINAVQFHPTSMVAFVAGSSKVISIFKVDGKDNTKLHTLKFQHFPISSASFIKDGDEIIAGCFKQSHFYTYNLITGNIRRLMLPHGITNMKVFVVSPDQKKVAIKGRTGEIHILDSTNFELQFTVQMNRICNVFDFTPDSKYLISHGECQDMYIWELSTRKCINRAIDDGCISCTSIAISPSSQFIATGSKQGVVNIYELSDVLKNPVPTPLKSIMNLVTAITALKFNPQSEILAILSKEKVNALKLVHLPSFTVFRNFPTSRTVLHKPISVAFSPASGFMSIGNNAGNAYLFKLKHYSNY